MDFCTGDEVEWSSQAGGSHVTKRGIVVQVVDPEGLPNVVRYKDLASTGIGSPRRHKSYVVEVVIGKKITSVRHYWPRVSALKMAGGAKI